MSIIITPGEIALISACDSANVEYTTENLLVGDIHIRKGDEVIYILERKAKGDLDASIKDGRYREQKGRMIESGVPRKNIIYIIEQLSKPRGPGAEKRVWSAICNSLHRDGFGVFQTKNVAETITFLQGLTRSVEQFTAIKDSKNHTEVNVNIKKRAVSENDWFKYSLTLIPKCSLSIAETIVESYPTFSSLIKEINESGNECLADLRHGATQRRVGKVLSERICSTLVVADRGL